MKRSIKRTFGHQHPVQLHKCYTREQPIKPSQWAERKRILSPVQGALPGPWDSDNTPYLREIMDNFAPDSPCREFVVMKATRLGFTSAMINVCGWIIDVHPCATRILIPNENTLKEVMNHQLNEMIISSQLESKIMATDNIKANKRQEIAPLPRVLLTGILLE